MAPRLLGQPRETSAMAWTGRGRNAGRQVPALLRNASITALIQRTSGSTIQTSNATNQDMQGGFRELNEMPLDVLRNGRNRQGPEDHHRQISTAKW